MREQAYVREAGLRDGIQMVKTFMLTETKLAWCRAEAAAGVREIEVTSFVPPSVVPQFADAMEVAREASRIPRLTASALVPNLKGSQRALDAGVHKINFVLSAERGAQPGQRPPHQRAIARGSSAGSWRSGAEGCERRRSGRYRHGLWLHDPGRCA